MTTAYAHQRRRPASGTGSGTVLAPHARHLGRARRAGHDRAQPPSRSSCCTTAAPAPRTTGTRRPAWPARSTAGAWSPTATARSLRSPYSDGALPLRQPRCRCPTARTRFYFEAARPDGAHDLITRRRLTTRAAAATAACRAPAGCRNESRRRGAPPVVEGLPGDLLEQLDVLEERLAQRRALLGRQLRPARVAACAGAGRSAAC